MRSIPATGATRLSGTEVLSLSERMRYLRIYRLVAVGLVLGSWAAMAESTWIPLRTVALVSALYLAFSLAGEVVWRLRPGRGRLLFGVLLLVDGPYLVWVVYASGTVTSPVRYLIILHVITVTLLASYRTGLKLALWQSLLLFWVFYGQEVGMLAHIPPSPGMAPGSEFRQLVAFVIVFWLAALATATFSAANERELRRRRFDLEALAKMARELEEAVRSVEVADVVLGNVVEAFAFERGALLSVSNGGLSVMASRGLDESAQSDAVDSVIRRAWAAKNPVLARSVDPSDDPMLTALFPRGRNLIVLPMVTERGPVGAMVLEHPARLGSRAQQRLVSMLERFTSHAELALRNAWLNEQLERMAATDGLTGVANRRTFGIILEKELDRATRADGPLGLILLDIDHFKRLNDHHGHQAGDLVLRRVAETLVNVARSYDTVARYGGEEFAIIVPGAAAEQSAGVAERMRRAVADIDAVEAVTVSAGVAAFPSDGGDPVTLVKRADEALYRSKREGRNRVAISTPGDGSARAG
jgi:diguanylate cyclase (GGDEF)-like protein